MALLAEYALTPDVFDSASYAGEEIGDLHLSHLKEALLDDGVVRSLRNGEWLAQFSGDGRMWHRRGKELLHKLDKQGRLRACAPVGNACPAVDCDWCHEALGSHARLPLGGIVVTDCVASAFVGNPLVASVTKLPAAQWWSERSPSARLVRTKVEYQRHLGLLLECSRSIAFIDAHLDPSQGRYKDFVAILAGMAGMKRVPRIELHRVCHSQLRGEKPDKRPDPELRPLFLRELSSPLKAAGMSIEAFFWDDFHDRHIVSNLAVLHLGNGLDTTTHPSAMTTWTRLGRREADDVRREFDPASGRHTLVERFPIP